MKEKILLILPLLVFLGACSRDKESSHAVIDEPVVRDVEVVSVEPGVVVDSFEAVGTVKARHSAVLSSKTLGTIFAVMAKEGDRIKKGQTLIEIDNRDLRADLQGAQAALDEANWSIKAAESAVASARGARDLAGATFKRYEFLIGRGSVTPQEFDEVSAKYKIADAELQHAEENLRAARARKKQSEAKVSHAETVLSYTKITSPFDGVVTAKNAEEGGLASPGNPLMIVEQSGLYRLEVQVGESSLADVKLSMAVPVVIDAIKTEFAGKVGEIVPAADPQSRTFTIKIEVPPHSLLRSGLYGKARFPTGKKEVLVVPSQAVIERGQLVGVYAVDDKGIVRLRLIKTGGRYDQRIEVLSGLTRGERIVARGIEKISEGSRVAPSPAK